MDDSKWRVRRIIVDGEAPPATLWDNYHIRRVKVAVWAVWPPAWAISGHPLLYFGTLPQAHTAATRRADFAQSPAQPQRPITLPEGWALWDPVTKQDIQ